MANPYDQNLYTPPSQLDPASADAAARMISSASMQQYGSHPNPQLVLEAAQTGSAPYLTQAIQSGDPSYQSLISASPAGSATQPTAQQVAPPPPTQAEQDVSNLDWNQFWKNNQGRLNDDRNSSFRSFGEVPITNLGYIQGVENQKDPKRIKQWQDLLKHTGFLDNKQETSGVWDTVTDAAFRGYMISRAMPQALYGQSQKDQDDAAAVLSHLGVDVNVMRQQERDPAFQGQVVQQWAAAQGPDHHVVDRSALQSFSDQFGEANLPQNYQSIIHENFFDWLRGGMSFLGQVPVIGRASDVAVNVLTGNVLEHPGQIATDPREIRADQIEANLSDSEKQALAPAINDIKADAGFMGIFDEYDRLRNKALLGIGYAVGDAFSGKGLENPFDPNSAAGRGALAHQDNLIGGILGDQWVNSHPVLGGVLSFAANVADDPLSYVPLLGEARIAERLAVATGRAARDVMTPAIRDAVDAALDTAPQRQREMVTTMLGVKNSQQSHGLMDYVHLLDEHADGDLGAERLSHIRSMYQSDDPTRIHEVMQNEFGHLAAMPSSWWNRRAFLKILGPNMRARLNKGRFSGLRAVGAFAADDNHLAAATNPLQAARKMEQRAIAAGMDARDVKYHLDTFLMNDDPNKVGQILKNFVDDMTRTYHGKLVMAGTSMDKFRTFVQQMRSGKSFRSEFNDAELVQLDHFGEMEGGGDVLRAPRDATAALEISQLNNLINHERTLATENQRLVEQITGDPGAGAAYAGHEETQAAIAESNQKIALAEQRIQELTRPAPLMPSQQADLYQLPYSTYEMLAYSNPVLRRAESIQNFIHIDAVMSTWKRLILARPASALRVTIGEDATRPIIDMALSGHPVVATRLAMNTAKRVMGTFVPGVRGKVLTRSEEILQGQLATDLRRQMSELDDGAFVPYRPDKQGYRESLSHVIRTQLGKDPMIQAWAGKGGGTEGRAAIRKWYESDDPRAVEQRRIYHVEKGSPELTHVIDRTADWLDGQFGRDKDVMRWISDGHVPVEEIKAKLKDPANHPNLPTISARRRSAYTDNVVLRMINKPSEWFHDHLTSAMVNAARAEGLMAQRAMAERRIRGVYGGKWDEAKIQAVADSMTRNWMRTNTYQGARSVMGQAVRNVFPFWGATANMNRFYLRQSFAKPFVGDIVLRAAAGMEQKAQSQNGSVTGLSSVLAHLGFTAGTALQFNPSHMFFLTSDGVASMVPGLGPVFTPVFNTIAKDQHLAEVLHGIPGIGEQLDYATGSSSPITPWLADALGGAYQAATGEELNIPLVSRGQDYITRREDELIRERTAQEGKPPTADEITSIKREVGRDLLTQGALSFSLPITPTLVDQRQQQLTNVLQQWNAAQSDAQKDTLIAQQLGVSADQWQKALQAGTAVELLQRKPDSLANALASRDRRFTSEERGALSQTSPWLTAYGTSEYETLGQKPATLEQFRMSQAQGNIHLLGPGEYVGRINDQQDVNTGWQAFDFLQQQKFQFMSQNGVASTDPLYKQWNTTVYQPALQQLESEHPTWAKTFGSGAAGKDVTSLLQKSKPLRSVETWEAIPQHSAYENQTSVAWRQALVWQQDAATALEEVMGRPHSQSEIDLVMQGLSQRLASLAQQDPTFAAQLRQYQFSQVQDIVSLQQQEASQQALYG